MMDMKKTHLKCFIKKFRIWPEWMWRYIWVCWWALLGVILQDNFAVTPVLNFVWGGRTLLLSYSKRQCTRFMPCYNLETLILCKRQMLLCSSFVGRNCYRVFDRNVYVVGIVQHLPTCGDGLRVIVEPVPPLWTDLVGPAALLPPAPTNCHYRDFPPTLHTLLRFLAVPSVGAELGRGYSQSAYPI